MRYKIINNTNAAIRIGGKIFVPGDTEVDIAFSKYFERAKRCGLKVEAICKEADEAKADSSDKVITATESAEAEVPAEVVKAELTAESAEAEVVKANTKSDNKPDTKPDNNKVKPDKKKPNASAEKRDK